MAEGTEGSQQPEVSASQERIRVLMVAPDVSYWLKRVLQEALDRDPVDAMRDLEMILQVLRMRFRELTQGKRREGECL